MFWKDFNGGIKIHDFRSLYSSLLFFLFFRRVQKKHIHKKYALYLQTLMCLGVEDAQ